MADQVPSSNRGWAVTLTALAINLVLGVLYAWGVILKALVDQWEWQRDDAAWPATVSTISFAVTMVFAGRLQDKIGPRLVAMVGGVILGIGLIASAYATTPLEMAIAFGVVGGMGIGLGYSATTPPAIKWFPPARKGLIAGIVVSGVGLAAVYMVPLTVYLLGHTGKEGFALAGLLEKVPGLPADSIAQTLFLLGVGAIAIVSVLAQFLSNPPAGYLPVPPAVSQARQAAAPAIARADSNWTAMLCKGQFYQLWFMFALTAAAGLMVIMHVAKIADEQAKMKWGFMAIVLLAIFNTVGRVFSGAVSDKLGRTNTMLVAFILQAANMVAFSYYSTPALVLFGASFTGFCYGAIFTLMPSATADFFGLKNLGVNYGLVFTAFGAAGVLGPQMAGMVFRQTHSYKMAYYIAAVMLLAGAILAFCTRAPKPKPQELQAA